MRISSKVDSCTVGVGLAVEQEQLVTITVGGVVDDGLVGGTGCAVEDEQFP